MSSTRRPGLGVLRRLRLRDVVLFTLLPFAAALYLLLASVGDYRRMTAFDDWWSKTARVDRLAWWRVRSALRLPRALELDHGLSAEDTQRPLVDLRVDRDAFDRMADDPVGRAGESVSAQLAQGNSLQDVELKLRGDTSVHWTGEKKTLAIKSDRGEMFHDSRVNVFSAKEVLAQFAANSMAADFELLAPPTAVVPVFVNQRFDGMFRAFAPLDETFLRNAGRIPGNIFRGDTAERGDYFKGLPRELFVNPYIWDRVAMNDRPGASGTTKLFELLERVQRAGSNEQPAAPAEVDAVSRLFEILERDEIARLFALDLCVGDPWHTSGVHNHFWYEDSSSGLLHPIPWDLRMLDLEKPPPGAQFNRFWRAALRDPRVFAKALSEIHARNRDGKLFAAVEARVKETWERDRDGFEYDRLRCGPPGTASNSDVGSPEEVLATLRKNLATLEGWCDDASAALAISRLDAETWMLDVLVEGHAPIDWVDMFAGKDRKWTAFADLDLDGAPSAGDRPIDAWPRLVSDPGGPRTTLLPGVRAGLRLESESLLYRFFVKGEGLDPAAIELDLRNALTGKKVELRPLAAGTVVRATNSLHPWLFREPPHQELLLEGDVHLAKTLEIPRNTTLRIAPGTKLTLDPDVSIHCKGVVAAWGTAELPITLASTDPKRPWGSFALWGDGASKSSFTNVRFSGGGGALLEDVEYTGMVCVHWAREVLFRDCEFTGNQRCDDALHADVADLTVSHCWFHDTNADALDLDISTALVEHCKVERAGNDGFDLMTCSPRIVGNEIRDNGDKGISIGENSSPFVFANTIRGCKRGIEVKDRSAPTILNDTIEGNKVGVLARLKNWRYERGGFPRLVRSLVAGNGENVDIESAARLNALDSRWSAEALGGAPFAGDLDWLYALNGVALDAPARGTVERWRETPLAQIVGEERFVAGWNAPEATWRIAGGVTSLRVDEDCLVVRTNARPGSLSRSIELDLRDESRTHWLVLEASGTDIGAARVSLVRVARPSDPLAAQLALGDGPGEFAFTSLLLPHGEYGSLTLDVEPLAHVPAQTATQAVSGGQVRLHRWFVVSALTAELGAAK
ncbi:MAG TPA: right-handed parallel beta-helix repeat-containing protein [Planctomycetota bacterium]|nr:right-handed parallel beta-helix repeat-containing protein [Planctomycetota bacterium]